MEEEKVVVLTEDEVKMVEGGAAGQKYIHYTIVKGDTLGKLAKRYGTTVDELVRINHIKNRNLIITGHTLLIPVK